MNKKIGIDIIEPARFKILKRGHHFIKKNFSAYEINYCFSFRNPAEHLAGIFAAKEAVLKALGATKNIFPNIEIRHDLAGAPIAYRKGKRAVNVIISISHVKNLAVAVAIAH